MSGNRQFYYFPLGLYRLGGIQDEKPVNKMDPGKFKGIIKARHPQSGFFISINNAMRR